MPGKLSSACPLALSPMKDSRGTIHPRQENSRQDRQQGRAKSIRRWVALYVEQRWGNSRGENTGECLTEFMKELLPILDHHPFEFSTLVVKEIESYSERRINSG